MINQVIDFVDGIDSIVHIKPHGNKPTCNKNIVEINPSIGCEFQCQYCNAYTQEAENQFNNVRVFSDFPNYLEDYLNNKKIKQMY